MHLSYRNRKLFNLTCPDSSSFTVATFPAVRETAYSIKQAPKRCRFFILRCDPSKQIKPERYRNAVSQSLVSGRIGNLLVLAICIYEETTDFLMCSDKFFCYYIAIFVICVLVVLDFNFGCFPNQSPVIWKTLKSFALKSERRKPSHDSLFAIHSITTFLVVLKSISSMPPPIKIC